MATILCAIYLVGFVITLILMYKLENNVHFIEEDYIQCWVFSIFWPIVLLIFSAFFPIYFIHIKLRGE